MAPVLSIGYGVNTQWPNSNASCDTPTKCATMFYTANYQYWQQNTTGYNYLYNSYYNAGGFGQFGYSSLICGGDSGGGDLFWDGNNNNWLLLSEHTYGPNGACGTFYNYLPNAATNVSAYYDWIQSIIEDHSPVDNCKSGAIANCVTNG
jgi:secreted trypsin-like serine protease